MRWTRATQRTFALTTLLSASLCLGSCEALRDLTYAQGKGENLYKIADYDGKTFTVSTGSKRFKGQTSRADELITLDGFDAINNLDAVELSFSEGLFKDVDLRDLIFYGKENHSYTFQYDITDHYVVLSKIAAREDIPSQELTYAESSGPEQYKVPVMGLPVSLFSVEVVEDERGKETRRLNEFPREYKKESDHFRIDLRNVKYFEATGKPDLFPVDYFDAKDEWFFTRTLVGRPIDSTAILGATTKALKIKFVRTNNSLLGVDLNIAEEQEVLDPTKTIVALEFPVEWVDFRLERSGSNAYLLETKLGDQEPTSRFWKDRTYALMDFNNADRLDQAFTLDNKLEKLEVGEDYLSFNIYESGTGYTWKYSLAKVNEVKKGQKYFAEDAKLFHIFTQKRTVIGGNMYTQTPDVEGIVYATRFFPDPEKKEIVYHLSANSPKVAGFEEAARYAIEAWDKAFQEADTGINVVFAPERVELGDVRYNQIVLYGYEIDSDMGDGSMLLGFGPSVQDTRSGETFSAATHIYLRAYREGLIRNIRSFIRNEIGLYDDKVVQPFNLKNPLSVGGTPLTAVGGTPVERSGGLEGEVANLDWLASADFTTQKTHRVARLTGHLLHSDAKKQEIADYRTKQEELAQKNLRPRCEYGNVAANSISWDKVRQHCIGTGGSKFAKYIEDLKAAHQQNPEVMNLPGEHEAILECSEPLMKDLLKSTLIHEIGHNLGLGHNFAASSDGVNFAMEDDGTTRAYPSSSVMDYPDRDFDVYSKAGPYDVAAIRYLYGRKIETKDGDFVDIPDGKSAAEAASGKPLKPYRMCTDYEIGGGNLPMFDPLCVKWDVGANPLEYVRWAIQKIHADVIERGYRYNQALYTGSMGASSYFSHFQQIHDYFRYLMQKQAGLYFEKISAGDIAPEQLIAVMDNTRDPNLTKVYYEAVLEIFEFCRKVLSLPSRVCVLENPADQSIADVFEFRDLRNRIFDKNNLTVQNCNQAYPVAGEVMKDVDSSADLTGKSFADRGIELDGLELDLDPAAASTKLKQFHFGYYKEGYGYSDTNPLYSAGMLGLKVAAARTLLQRTNGTMAVTQASGVSNISFVDFPWFRDTLYMDVLTRIVYGLDGAKIDPRFEGTNKRFGHYREYEDLLWFELMSLLGAVGDPRSKAYYHTLSLIPMREASQSSFNKTLEEQDDIWYVLIKSQYYLYSPEGSFAGYLLRTMAQIGQVPALEALKETLDSDPAGEDAKIGTAIAAATNNEELLAAVETYLKGHQLALQPPQKTELAKVLPSMDPTEVRVALREFLNKAVMQGSIIKQMVAKNDYDNLVSLNAIVQDFIESIY